MNLSDTQLLIYAYPQTYIPVTCIHTVCLHICVCLYVCAYALCICVCGIHVYYECAQEARRNTLIYQFPFYSLKIRSLTKLRARLVLHTAGVQGTCSAILTFSLGAGDLNTGPHACAESAPSPSPFYLNTDAEPCLCGPCCVSVWLHFLTPVV